MNESCISSGFPEPVIIWTSNTDYISNDRLIIQPGDFSIDDFVNPYEFTCTANNTEGEDSSLIRIRVDIDLTKMIGNLSHVTSEILVEYTEIIQRNIRGVNYTYEQHSVVREVVDRSASSLDSLVQKFNDTDADTDVLETILQTGDDIIQLELQQPVVVEVEITEVISLINSIYSLFHFMNIQWTENCVHYTEISYYASEILFVIIGLTVILQSKPSYLSYYKDNLSLYTCIICRSIYYLLLYVYNSHL